MSFCHLCPRNCGVDRRTQKGRCAMPEEPVVARAGVHLWEEPCISGTKGSGTVFFSGCSLRCVFCQNYSISWEGFGAKISVDRLRDIFLELVEKGVHNINLVSPTHYAAAIAQALESPLPVPVVYNSSGYESVETLKMLEGKIQIYLPDMKYAQTQPAAWYSGAADYPEVARKAIQEMYRQVGPYQLGEDGVLRRGLVVRHLILPSHLSNTYGVIDWFAETFSPGQAMFSLMSQYTPMGNAKDYPRINRPITRREREMAERYLFSRGIEDGFVQGRNAAREEFVPAFDLSGVLEGRG